MWINSTDFKLGQPIGSKHSLHGGNEPPLLNWGGAPSTTKSFVLIMDDPDAPGGTWVHWVMYDIPAMEGGIFKGEVSGISGINSWDNATNEGPAPPSGVHRYIFKVYAINSETLGLSSGARKIDVIRAAEPYTIDSAQVYGTFSAE